MKRALTSIFMIIIIFFSLPGHAKYQSSFTIYGLETNSDALDNVTATLTNLEKKIKNSKKMPNITSITRQVDGRVRSALEPFGYFNASTSTTIEERNKVYLVTVSIDLGPPVMVRHVSIQIHGAAKNDPAFQQLINQSDLIANTQLPQCKLGNSLPLQS